MRAIVVVLLSASLLLAAGCSRKSAADLAAEMGPLPKAASAIPVKTGPTSEFEFLPAGLPYPEARKIMFANGFEPAPDKAKNPPENYPDIECWGERPYCEAHFIKLQTEGYREGWKRYAVLLVNNDRVPIVTSAHYATTANGLLDIPPPDAPDIPKLDRLYVNARNQLVAMGYEPIDASDDLWEGCAPEDDGLNGCSKPIPMPEVNNCSGTGFSFCQMFWRAPDGRILRIETYGEPPPRNLYYSRWATAKDLEDMKQDSTSN